MMYFGASCRQMAEVIQKSEIATKEPESPFAVYASDKEEEPTASMNLLPYQRSYPDLHVENSFQYEAVKDKMVYLTFDDGPTALTPKVLDLLKKYDVKATFFIVYRDDENAKAIYRRMIAEGHTIGVHSTTHRYKEIYQSVDACLADFAKTAQMLKEVTGVAPEIFRFPGGSINGYNESIYQQLIAEMTRRGYTYYDWNVGSDDTTKSKTADSIYSNVVKGVSVHKQSIALMHDLGSHETTLNALPKIIETLKAEGYTFEALDKTVQPVMFGYGD